MSTREHSPLPHHLPFILTATAAALTLAYLTYHYLAPPPAPPLHRSNARRETRRRPPPPPPPPPPPRPQTPTTPTSWDTQLASLLATPGTPPITIPDAVASALTETGHAAQSVRGAGASTLDGRTARAARHPSPPESEFSYTPSNKSNTDNQNLLTLLYTIAHDQATRESYIHRGVTCNNCGMLPIRGIRFRCTTCVDFDLCESCEAIDTVHPKTHLFYKIRIPAPFIGNTKNAPAPTYPGRPHLMPQSLGQENMNRLSAATRFESPELEALYEQFKVLAAAEYTDEVYQLNMAISRDTFNRCFIPTPSPAHPAAPSLVYDRMFRFYDTNSDGLISFDEFVSGIAATTHTAAANHKPAQSDPWAVDRWQRIFRGYDLNDDGLVSRADMVRIFRAYYAVTRDMVRDCVAPPEETVMDPYHMENAVTGRQPLSAAFVSPIHRNSRGNFKPAGLREDDAASGPVILEDDSAERGQGLGFIRRRKSEGDEVERERKAVFWEEQGGAEVLEQLSVMGIHELLDALFKDKERDVVERRKKEGAAMEGGEVEMETSLSWEEFQEKVEKDANRLDFLGMFIELACF